MKSLQRKLSRITDGRKIIPEIEGLRFVSILLVALSHINNNLLRNYPENKQGYDASALGIFLEQAGAGVSVFFFISGFILSIPFLQDYVYHSNKVSIRHYYYRRLTRIEPPYLISLIIFLLLAIFILKQAAAQALPHFAASAVYSHNIIYNHISTINPVAWTLEIEVQFYLVFPLMAMALFAKNVVTRRIVLLAAFIIAAYVFGNYMAWFNKWHLTKSVFAYLPVFITGMMAADLFLAYKNALLNKQHWLWDVVFLAALYYIITLSGFQSVVIKLLVLLCYLLLFIAGFKSIVINKVITNKWIVIIGGMCYSIYLVHYAVIFFITELFSKKLYTNYYYGDVLIQTVIIVPAILVVSSLFFMLLERPFMNITWPQQLKKYLSGKATQ